MMVMCGCRNKERDDGAAPEDYSDGSDILYDVDHHHEEVESTLEQYYEEQEEDESGIDPHEYESWPTLELMSHYKPSSSLHNRKILFLDSMEVSSSVLKLWRTEIQNLTPVTDRPKELCLENVHFKLNVETHHVTRFLAECKELEGILLLGDREARYPYPNHSLEQYGLVMQSLQHRSGSILGGAGIGGPYSLSLPTTCKINTLCLSRLRLQGKLMGQLLVGAISSTLTDLHVSSCFMDLAFAQGFATASANATDATTTTTSSMMGGGMNAHADSSRTNHSNSLGKLSGNRSRANTNSSISTDGTTTTNAPLQTLELSSCSITDSMMETFARDNEWEENRLQVLSFELNDLTATSLASLALLLGQHTASLQTVCLGGNGELFDFPSTSDGDNYHTTEFCDPTLPSAGEGGGALSSSYLRSTPHSITPRARQEHDHEVSSNNTATTHLQPPLAHFGWQSFLKALGSLHKLQLLDLNHCPMTVQVAAELLLSLPPTCVELNLDHTHLFQQDHCTNNTITTNYRRPLKRWVHKQKEQRIESIDMEEKYDEFDHDGEAEDKEGEPLRHLPIGSMAFFDAIAEDQTSLKVLHLEGCNISNDVIVPLFQALETNLTLSSLKLSGNGFDVCGWERSLPHLVSLQELDLPTQVGCRKTWPCFQHCFQNNTSLTTIRGTKFLQQRQPHVVGVSSSEPESATSSADWTETILATLTRNSELRRRKEQQLLLKGRRRIIGTRKHASVPESVTAFLNQWLFSCCFKPKSSEEKEESVGTQQMPPTRQDVLDYEQLSFAYF